MAICDAAEVVTPAGFARDVADWADAALSGRHGRRQRFSIGLTAFELAAPDGGDDAWLGRAFLAAQEADSSRRVHLLSAWDGLDPASHPAHRPWGEASHEPLGVVNSFSDADVRCAFDVHTSSLIVCDYRADRSFTWFPQIAPLPAWAKASPFRIALSWLLNRHQMQLVHGAAVSVGGKAALLAGAGGSGKSTTALACALAGMGYLGDDYCAIAPEDGQVHLIYRTAKVLPTTLAMLPSLERWLVNVDTMAVEKGVMFLASDDVALTRSADIGVILLPRLSPDGRSSVTPATRAEAIHAILPSTIGGLMGGTAYTPRAILRLAQGIPAFHLNLGPDIDTVVDAVAGAIGRHA